MESCGCSFTNSHFVQSGPTSAGAATRWPLLSPGQGQVVVAATSASAAPKATINEEQPRGNQKQAAAEIRSIAMSRPRPALGDDNYDTAPTANMAGPTSAGRMTINPLHRHTGSMEVDRNCSPPASPSRAQDESARQPPSLALSRSTSAKSTRSNRSDRSRASVDPDASCSAWCRPGNVLLVVLNVLVLGVTAAYVLFQGTDIIDTMVNYTNHGSIRMWLLITPFTQAVVYLVCIPSFIGGTWSLVQITCLWRRTLLAHRQKQHRKQLAERRRLKHGEAPTTDGSTKGRLKRALRAWGFWRGKDSPLYLYKVFVNECWEACFQLLSLNQFSAAGVDRMLLLVYSITLLLNCCSPLLIIYIQKTHVQKRRKHCGLMLRRLMLFDAFIDTLYAAFPIASLLIRYFELYPDPNDDDNPGDNELMRAACLVVDIMGVGCGTTKKYLLLNAARQTFFGGNSLWVVFVKVKSRMLPLVLAPWRIVSAFKLGFGIRRRSIRTSTGARRSIGLRGTSSESDGESMQEAATTRGTRRQISAFLKKQLSQLQRRGDNSDRLVYYYQIPVVFPAILALVMGGISLAAITTLLAWTPCDVQAITDSCAVRSYPLFGSGAPEEGGSRSCACHAFFYHPNLTCTATEETSRFLESDPYLLQHASILFVVVCLRDAKVPRVLDKKLRQPTAIYLQGWPKSKSWHFAGIVDDPTIAPPDDVRVQSAPWEIFSNVKDISNVAETLQVFCTDHIAVSLRRDFWKMKQLFELKLEMANLTVLPPEIGRLKTLAELSLPDNHLETLPTEICQLSSLNRFSVVRNMLSSFPECLSELQELSVDHNRLQVIPDSIARMTNLETFDATANLLREVQPRLWTLPKLRKVALNGNTKLASNQVWQSFVDAHALRDTTATSNAKFELKEVHLSDCGIDAVPSSAVLGLEGFDNLATLDLAQNRITYIDPGVLRGLPNLKYLTMDDNLLTALPTWLLTSVPSLQHLYVNNNLISQLDHSSWQRSTAGGVGGGSGTGLSSLFLDGNALRELDASTFLAPEHLTRLSIRENQLTRVDFSVFAQTTRLEFLHLGNNRISEMTGNAATLIPHLSYFVLDNNPLAAVPRGVENLEKLAYLGANNISKGAKDLLATIPFASLAAGGQRFGAFDGKKGSRMMIDLQDNSELTFWPGAQNSRCSCQP